MNALKVILGTAAGVGAVACLPVAGAVGTVTLLGAALGGTVGGVAGGFLSDADDEESLSEFREGIRVGEKGGWEKCLHQMDHVSGDLSEKMEALKARRDELLKEEIVQDDSELPETEEEALAAFEELKKKNEEVLSKYDAIKEEMAQTFNRLADEMDERFGKGSGDEIRGEKA